MATNKEITKKTKQFQISDISYPAAFHTAAGMYFEDIEGNRVMDFSSGYGVSNIGWQHPQMLKAMEKQLNKSNYCPPWMPSEESANLGERLANLVSVPNALCMRATGGADANEILLKSTYGNNKGDVLSFEMSYHGGTHATIGLGEPVKFNLPHVAPTYYSYKVQPPHCFKCPWGQNPNACQFQCASAIDSALQNNPNIKTFFAEPVIGSGGVIVPPKGYYSRVEEICSQRGVTLIFDEVLTGMGRTGSWFAHQKFDVAVDGVSLAKGLSSGYAALGAAIMDASKMGNDKSADDVSSSFAWTPFSCAISLETIRIIESENLVANAEIQGDYLGREIRAILNKYAEQQLGEVRQCGLMIGVDWNENPGLSMRFLLKMLKRGLMWCASWDYNTMIALPPLIISKSDCDHALNIIEDTAKEMFPKR
jgi:4-aminobutyrate aminotransferase-like enzyme